MNRFVFLLKQSCNPCPALQLLYSSPPEHPTGQYLRHSLHQFALGHMKQLLDGITSSVTLYSLNNCLPSLPVPCDLSALV